MRAGPLVTAILAGSSMGAVIFAFAANASPYVTVAQAKSSTDDRMHLSGTLVKDSVQNDVLRHKLRFRLRDSEGATILVEHDGERPSTFMQATKIVAVGGVEKGVFRSEKLIVKCPSKYEETKG